MLLRRDPCRILADSLVCMFEIIIRRLDFPSQGSHLRIANSSLIRFHSSSLFGSRAFRTLPWLRLPTSGVAIRRRSVNLRLKQQVRRSFVLVVAKDFQSGNPPWPPSLVPGEGAEGFLESRSKSRVSPDSSDAPSAPRAGPHARTCARLARHDCLAQLHRWPCPRASRTDPCSRKPGSCHRERRPGHRYCWCVLSTARPRLASWTSQMMIWVSSGLVVGQASPRRRRWPAAGRRARTERRESPGCDGCARPRPCQVSVFHSLTV